jgi:hypothetical protein
MNKAPGTVRDKLWVFTVVAGADDANLALGGVTTPSRMTPAEGAFFLGVPNLLLIRSGGRPPVNQFEQYAQSFRPLNRVVWSIVGSGGRHEGDELSLVLPLARQFPNISGVFLDDFFVRAEAGSNVFTGALSPGELDALRPRLALSDRDLEMWVTFYSRVLDPSHPRHFTIDLPLSEYLDRFDIVTLWTRGEERVRNLPDYVSRLEAAVKRPRIVLGCDFWDFVNRAPVPVALMEYQCNLGLEWLQQGRIDGMIVEWTREWIAAVGDSPIG